MKKKIMFPLGILFALFVSVTAIGIPIRQGEHPASSPLSQVVSADEASGVLSFTGQKQLVLEDKDSLG